MSAVLQIEIDPSELIEAVRRMPEEERQAFLEDLLAATSPEYLRSIQEARGDYEAGRVVSHEDVFGQMTLSS